MYLNIHANFIKFGNKEKEKDICSENPFFLFLYQNCHILLFKMKQWKPNLKKLIRIINLLINNKLNILNFDNFKLKQ